MVEELKHMEEQLAGRLFPQDNQAVEKYRLFQNTTEVFKELPTLPVDVLGNWMDRIQTGTVEGFYKDGKVSFDVAETLAAIKLRDAVLRAVDAPDTWIELT